MRRFLALALLTLTLALASAPAAALAAPPTDHFNVKFTFTLTDFVSPDGQLGVIRAGSKSTSPSGNKLTVCGYYSTTDSYLGQFESSSFSSQDSSEVLNFCLANFVNRTL